MNINELRVRFLGGAETVTGSKYLLSFNRKNILIDCGLFQGLKELRLKNWDRFPIDPKSIDAIVLTHAHIDHSGYIPRLIKEGFQGKVYCTQPTLALCHILLPDTGHIQEEEAEWLNRKQFTKHSPALPLFSEAEAEKALKQFHGVGFDEPLEVAEGLQVTFRYAGHILGAASVIIKAGGVKVGFSGDVGRINDSLMHPPANLPAVDYLVVESTYGDRTHPPVDTKEELRVIINESFAEHGVILIPSFTVGRAQSLMHFIAELKKEDQIPNIPTYLNSPMATNVTNLFHQFRLFHKLTPQQCDEMCNVVRYVKSVEESKALNLKKGPMIIISASGMMTGGRILHHLKAFGPDPSTTILLAGFQAAGTRGRSLQDGSREIKFHKEIIPIRAKVASLENISAHADHTEIIEWISKSQIAPKKVFITHGEVTSAQALSEHFQKHFSWPSIVPRQDQEFLLD